MSPRVSLSRECETTERETLTQNDTTERPSIRVRLLRPTRTTTKTKTKTKTKGTTNRKNVCPFGLNSRVKMELVDVVREFREFSAIFSEKSVAASKVRHVKAPVASSSHHLSWRLFVTRYSWLRCLRVPRSFAPSLLSVTTDFRICYFCWDSTRECARPYARP